jgi:hypothetical protein
LAWQFGPVARVAAIKNQQMCTGVATVTSRMRKTFTNDNRLSPTCPLRRKN